jgi:broad specificity phosphatase PhoE
MSTLTFVRHGQAGSRDVYDTLSPLGRQQASRLGEYLATQSHPCDLFLSGALERQQLTAALLRAACPTLPAPTVLPAWNEFDLDAVYRSLAPQLAAVDPVFADAYNKLRAESADPLNPVHRRWTHADIAVIRAWVEGRFPSEAETWEAFSTRIRQAFAALPDGHILISTSATPIALCVSFALEAPNPFRFAGALYNASLTTFRRHDGQTILHTFNNTPHLPEPDWRTHR